MKLHESKYVIIDWEPSTSIISYIYTPDADERMTADDFKYNMTAYGNLCEQHQPERLLIDLRHLRFTITPDLQEWTAKEIAPRTTSLQRMAILVSNDIFAQVSLEQLMEEEGIADKYSAPRYFDSESEAKNWLTE
ncbi:hypothetical protein [Rhodoflexus caldus]|uniref:hypothetical protein n=1 Tax=Rhodoflexus caldus TaxID=2891236 RepID=UPI002029BA7A|nr:hypothetical protein [Rhodoflexus caldus]